MCFCGIFRMIKTYGNTDPFHEPLLAVRRPPHAGRKLGREVDPFFVPAGHQGLHPQETYYK